MVTLDNRKLMTLQNACMQRETLRQQKKTLVLTNGCFDLLHTGHLYSLNEAARQGDVLWVILNGDASVRSLKGPTRPILPEPERAYALACLSCVQGIIIFQTPRLDHEIRMLRPDSYVKAGYTMERLDPEEQRALQESRVTIHFLPLLSDYSTTNLVERIKSLESKAVPPCDA